MRKIVRYKCQYCGIERASMPDMAKHEELCKDYTTTKKAIEGRFTALFGHYARQGWRISIACNDEEIYVNAYKPREKRN